LSSTPLSVHVILFLGQICFASLSVVGRLAVGHIPPAGIVMVRMAGGVVVFSLIAWRRGTLKLQRGDLPLIVLCALLGSVINQELFIHGLAHTTATNAVVVGSTIPVFTAITAIVLGREPVRARRLFGMAVAFGGVAALVGAEEVSTRQTLGSVLVLIGAVVRRLPRRRATARAAPRSVRAARVHVHRGLPRPSAHALAGAPPSPRITGSSRS
jgi:drug/metabolite transporter (DMT)-like permease